MGSNETFPLERKAATTVLLRKSGSALHGWRFEVFGDEAEKRYLLERAEEGGGEDLASFKHFKMELFRGGMEGRGCQTVDGVMAIATDDRVELPLVYVVSLVLRNIKEQILAHLSIDNSDVKWVVTIPAIWSPSAKIFMRTAALRAGLIDVMGDYEKLRLCLEPEAACLSMEHLSRQPWEAGMKLLFLDCGGGTIDVVTHRAMSKSPIVLHELEEPTGGPWGSTMVDTNFKHFLKALLGCHKEEWKKLSNSPQMLELMADWENKKTNYKQRDSVRLGLDRVLEFLEMDLEMFKALVDKYSEMTTPGWVTTRGRRITLGPDLVETFFNSVLIEIVRVTKDVLQKQPDISVVYMVGGFSCSPLLQEAVEAGIKREYGNARVITPRRPSLAIVMGAAFFGAKDSSIISRKARLTYGTSELLKYNKRNEEHRQRTAQAKNINGRLYISVFKPYVQMGDDLPVDMERERQFTPMTNDQSSIAFDILASKRSAVDIQYLEDAEVARAVHTVTVVKVDLDMTFFTWKRGVSMRLSFGGTEMGVRCTRLSDGRDVTVTTTLVENIDEFRAAGPTCR